MINSPSENTATSLPRIQFVLRERGDDGGRTPLAAVAIMNDRTVFIPASLPCGQCGPCRRALVSSCVARLPWLGLDLQPLLPISDRFAYAFDPHILAPRLAPWAALLLPWLEAMGRAGLGTGDLSFWLGDNHTVLLGAFLATARGSRAVVSGPPWVRDALAGLSDVPHEGRPSFASVDQLDNQALAAQTNAPSGFIERHIYTAGDDSVLWSAAGALLQPGTTLVAFGGLPALAGLPADARIITLGEHANPDFAPEALAALARDPSLATVCAALGASGTYDVWPHEAQA